MPKASISPLTIFAGAGATLLILLVSIFLSFQRFSQLKSANSWNIHTYQVLVETSNLMRGLINIQTGARGYLQTRDESFLEPYKAGREEYRTHYKQALRLTRDRAIQQKRLQLLQRQYTIWMNGYIDPLIQMRRSTADTGTALRRAAPGVKQRKIIMDAMRQTVASIEKTENDLLQQRTQRENRLQALTQTTLLLNGAFAIVLATGLSVLLAAGARRLQSTNHQLTEQMAHRERAEREAELLNEHNEMILQAARDGIAGINQAGKTTFFNPAAEAITGYTAQEVIGKSHHDLLHYKRADGSLYPIQESPITATLKDGKPRQSDDEVFWRQNGTPVPVEFTCAPLVMCLDDENCADDNGRQAGAVIIFRDITERRRSEQAMQELASIVQYSDDAIIGLTLNGVITRWNRAATKLFGFTEFEMVGQYADKLVPADTTDELPQLLEKVKRHQHVERYETSRTRRDGSLVRVVLSLSPILNQVGEVTGASIISREVFRNRTQSKPQVEQGTASANGGSTADHSSAPTNSIPTDAA